MNGKVKIIARNGIIAALYVVFTLLTYPFSFGLYQFRAAELLVLLCFFRKDYTFGLTIGCAIVNLFSQLGMIDVLFGTLATLLACLGVCFCKHLWVAAIIPIVVNGLVVGMELVVFAGVTESFWYCAAFVALGELTAMALGYVMFMLLKKRNKFFELIEANQNREFRC